MIEIKITAETGLEALEQIRSLLAGQIVQEHIYKVPETKEPETVAPEPENKPEEEKPKRRATRKKKEPEPEAQETPEPEDKASDPEEASEDSKTERLSLEEVQGIALELSRNGKKDKVLNTLAAFKTKRIKDLDESEYENFVARLKA